MWVRGSFAGLAAVREHATALTHRLLLVASATPLVLVLVANPAAAAPNGVVDPPATGSVGTTASPNTAWLSAVQGCTHYVDANTTGPGDTGPGTATQPWKTIGHAMKTLQRAQTGCVRGGTYAESALLPARSGTATEPIALRGQGLVLIIPKAAENAPANQATTFAMEAPAGTASLSHWLLEGLTIDKGPRDAATGRFLARDGVGVQLLGVPGRTFSHVALRNLVVRNGKGYAGFLVRGNVTDVLIERSTVTGFSRWRSGTSVTYEQRPGHQRDDSHGLAIDGTGSNAPSVQRLVAIRNTFADNGGDGVQCLGANDAAGPMAADPADIDLVDTRVVNTPSSAPVEENAVDIKSCQRVSLRGSDPPSTTSGGVQWNKFAEFLPTRKNDDLGGTNTSNGDAVVIHFSARGVLVENLRIWDACSGISMGRSDATVRNVAIRRVLIFSLRAGQAPPGGTAQDAERCRGRGVQATRVQTLDLYHLTLDEVPERAVYLNTGVTDADLWNSLIQLRGGGTTPRWVELASPSDTIDSDYNLFWHTQTGASGKYFRAGGPTLNLAGWRATGRDRDRPDPLGSHGSNPQFIDNPRLNDYFTRPGSLARDGALANVPAAPVCGARPDIGFLESCST